MNKTIEINPSLFSNGSLKTKKNKKPQSLKPLISPNVMKHKLLKRIRQHKLNETQNFESNKNVAVPEHFHDEFQDSLNYLQMLSEKNKQDLRDKTKKNNLEKKTVKNYSNVYAPNESIAQNEIQIDLPEEFTSPLITINPQKMIITDIVTEEFNTINTPKLRITDDVPYGVLKNGNKPTYRCWNKTHRNSPDIISKPILNNAPLSDRELKLNNLKDKLLQKNSVPVPVLGNLAIPSIKPPSEYIMPSNIQFNSNSTSNSNSTINSNSTSNSNSNSTNNHKPENTNVINTNTPYNEINTEPIHPNYPFNRKTIKTIKKKYTLGKSKTKRQISLLIKSNDMRKKIIMACKDLKRHSINDVKQYLKEHNLMTPGSAAPPDVLRKIYESSIMTGEITNLNRDTLINNFLKSDTS